MDSLIWMPLLSAAVPSLDRASTAIPTPLPTTLAVPTAASAAHLTLNEIQQLVADVAAYRERADITGPDPLGPPPVDSDPLAQTHRSIETRIEATRAATPRVGLSIE